MTSPVIEARRLCRSFGGKPVVADLDFSVPRGTVFGLLGPNGAGKTTTIRMLTTLLAPDGGTAYICGFDILRQPGEVRRRTGYVMQRIAYRGLLTGREIVEIEAALYHVPRKQCRKRAEEMLELVGLTESAEQTWTTYSGGMQKRLDLACGLLHKPEVLILDEPSLGLDVQSRHSIWEHIRGLRDEGVTILLATNYLDEADRLCDDLAIIDHGRTVVAGSPAALKQSVGADVIDIRAEVSDAFRSAIASAPWTKQVLEPEGGQLQVYVEDAARALPAVMQLALETGVELERVTYSQPTLDDVFLLHTGRELREEGSQG